MIKETISREFVGKDTKKIENLLNSELKNSPQILGFEVVTEKEDYGIAERNVIKIIPILEE